MSTDKTDSLISAIREGSLARVDELIEALGLSNSLAWSDGYALLREAIDNGRTAIAKLILMNINTEIDGERLALTRVGRNALSNIVNIVQFTILELTVIIGDSEILRLLLDKDADSGDLYAKQLLHVAVRNGKMAIVKFLLNRGADPNYKSKGLTPLHIAVEEGSVEIAGHLLAHGARVDAACSVGPASRTALHLAIENASASLVKLLLAHGASVEASGNNQHSALKLAFDKGHSIITAYVYVCSMDLRQTSRMALLDAVDRSDYSYRAIFQRFFRTYSLANFANRRSMLPILVHAATQSGFLKIVHYFLTLGFEINGLTVHNPQAKERQTLLHSAVKSFQLDVVELLIKNGSDTNVLDSYQKSPIFYAVENVDVGITRLLIANGARLTNAPRLLCSAAMNASSPIVDMILQHETRIDINGRDNFGNTALHYVCIGSPNETCINGERNRIVKALLARGADVNARGLKDAGPLHFAVQGGRVEIVEELLAHGADVNLAAARDSGTTPLHECARYATGNASVAIVKMLLARNAEVDARTDKGITALHHASDKGNTEVVEILLEHDAEVDAKSHDGVTALHRASLRGFVETIAVLLKFGADINVTCDNGRTAPVNVLNRFVNNEISCSRRCRCKKLVYMFQKHIVKMRAVGLYVSKENLRILRQGKNRLAVFEEDCKSQIPMMKTEKISGNASFYDILVKDVHEVAIYARYESVVKTMESKGWREKFPIYCDMIWNKFRKGQRREVLLNSGVDSFNLLFEHQLLDVLTIEIFRYLSNEDLGNLIKACQSGSRGEPTSYVESAIKILTDLFAGARNFALKSNISFY